MKVLVVGSGGREHALAWKIAQSDHCSKVYVSPGNGGTAEIAENVQIAVDDHAAIRQFITDNQIEMIVIGPEIPLVNGLADDLQDVSGLKIVGPQKSGAMLEGSKSFAKEFMDRHNIPTASYVEINSGELQKGLDAIENMDTPIVLKADGLAAGKGVIITEDRNDAAQQLKDLLEGKFGEASKKVIIEEFLDGIEFSVFILTDGKHYVLLPNAKDYKRIGEGDKGLNTGGMGAISPVPFVKEELMAKVESRIIRPTISGIQQDNLSYTGFLYFGLIVVGGEPYVIEYNCRLGDPETEVILPRIQGDLLMLMDKICSNSLINDMVADVEAQHAVTVVLASGGYPESYQKGYPIEGLKEIDGTIIFHAGTANQTGIKTSGGRVMMLTSLGSSLQEALDKSYQSARKVQFQDKYFRSDIGYEFLA